MENIIKKNYLEILKTFFIALLFLAIGAFIGVNFIPSTFNISFKYSIFYISFNLCF